MTDHDHMQRAREMLAAEYERDGITHVPECIRHDAMLTEMEHRAIRAIAAALRSQAEAGELAGADMGGADRTRAELHAEIDRLREALAWYAEAENYYSPPGGGNPVREDMGNRARKTLAPKPEQAP